MAQRIFLSTPHMSDEGYEVDFVRDAFEKNWIAPLGENVTGFEQDMAAYMGGGNMVALASGTAALHLAAILAGVGRDDLVFCQDLTFAASVNPVAYQGGRLVLIDSERDTWNMDPAALRKAIDRYGVPKAVVVVHLYGNPAKMEEICAICEEHGITLIEDAAEALGSEYRGKKCGLFGAFGALSFNGNKIITTSGGGMLVCETQEQAARALKLATQAREPFPWYHHEEIGYNYRLSNISAGIGRGQMKVLPLRVEQKHAICANYTRGLAGLPLTMQPVLPDAEPNRWLSSILLDENCGVTSSQIIEALQAVNAEARHLWKPMHAQPVFADVPFVGVEERAVSDDLFERGVCLPSDTKMTPEDVERVCSAIRQLFE